MTATATTSKFGRKDWPPIIRRTHQAFPVSASGPAEWATALADTDLMGELLRDLLQLGPDSRQVPTFEEGIQRLAQLRGEDYTSDPFRAAFVHMTRGLSRRQVADRCGLSTTRAHRLLSGFRGDTDRDRTEEQPTMAEMERIAAAFNRDPTYFAEYRARMLSVLVHQHLTDNPEASATLIARTSRKIAVGG